jgi:hypothetical protein
MGVALQQGASAGQFQPPYMLADGGLADAQHVACRGKLAGIDHGKEGFQQIGVKHWWSIRNRNDCYCLIKITPWRRCLSQERATSTLIILILARSCHISNYWKNFHE